MNKETVIHKLKHLTTQISDDLLPDKKLQMISKLLIELDFYDELETGEKSSTYSQNELVKFLSMGWYIYSNLKNT
jgi:hypothetical protein